MESITQQALRILEEEKQAAQVEEQKRIASAKAEAAAKARAERAVRVQLQAERELARIAAERALAAEEAVAVQAAEAAALQAELARLRARSEIEVLRDEMASLKKTIEDMKSSQQVKMTEIVKTIVTERKFQVTFPRPNEALGMSCNFKDKNGNIIFHYNPRPSHLVLNSKKKNESWGSEEHIPWIGYLQNIWGSELLIKVTPEGFFFSRYQIANFDLFRHRIPVNLDEISFDYDQRMTCIEL